MGWFYSWLNKLSSREKRFLYVTVFLISLFLLDRFVIQRVLGNIDRINTEIDQRNKQLTADQIYLDKKNRQLIEGEYKTFMPLISTTQLTSAAASKLVEDIASKTSITIDKIEPLTTRESSKKITIQITCVGDRKNLITFLYHLSTSSVFLTLNKFTLSPKKEDFVAVITLSQTSLQTE